MISPKLRYCVSGLIQTITVLLMVAWAAGQILRDCNWWMALLFYFPTPVLIGWLLLVLAVFRKNRRIHLLMLVAPLAMLLLVENHWMRPEIEYHVAESVATDATDLASSVATQATSGSSQDPNSALEASTEIAVRKRLVHWNVARGVMGWEKQREYIESLQPDIIVLSEIPEPFDSASLTGFDVLVVEGMAVACHGSTIKSKRLFRGGALISYQVSCMLAEGRFELLIADVTSRITVPRDPFLRRFVPQLSLRSIDVSVGDFNSPRRSLAFESLPAGFQHAYDAAGAGWSYTWPVPVPCLAIDQCMTGPNVHSVNYELSSTLLSDHRLQILDFDWIPRR